MRSADIRSRFLAHFEKNGHTVVPSASLIADDPTLLLVPAGMVPFKPYFLGEAPPPYPRAASVQKCVRTVDIENVGRTTRHGSFFQMAGNFSFGDYFKEGAIPLAWSLLTDSVDDGGFGFDPDRLWATVYLDDDEAFELWRVHLPEDRIQRRGKEDNYWHMGVPGPGGPCSEIYFDRGPAYGVEGGPVADEDRYLEVWNLVFMQYQLGAVRSKVDFDIVGDLPAKNIDTGMGLERMAIVLQGVDNFYEIDQLRPILDRAGELTSTRYGDDAEDDVSLRVIAEHLRTTSMLILDGVTPSNEGRGYVLRRMLRRAVRKARILGATEPVTGELVTTVRDAMGEIYPELVSEFERVSTTTVAEEENFLNTLRTGTTRFEVAVADTKKAGTGALSGEQAFLLHDTYGFPYELTLEMAAEQGLTVDEAAFRRLMDEQRARARADRKGRGVGHADVAVYRQVLDAAGPSEFTGYDEQTSEAVIRGLVVNGGSAHTAKEGDEVEVVLDRTPFYAEAGGQLPDHGRLRLADGTEIEIDDVQKPVPGLVVHSGRVVSGAVEVGDATAAEVDIERRLAISRAHTATHLIHTAFRRALGDTAAQAGSLNAPGRLRFDFTSPAAVPPSVLGDVEAEVNAILINDLEVRAYITSLDEARKGGALALFGEKYGEEVRVVEVGQYAKELCGGTHAQRSGQLGVVKLLSEASVGAGVRRVEGLVGIDAFSYLAREPVIVSQLAETLKARPDELPERIDGLLSRVREVEKELERVRGAAVLQAAGGLAAAAQDVYGVAVVATEVPEGTSADDARKLALDIRGRIEGSRPAVVAVAVRNDGRAQIVVAVNGIARQWGVAAGALVKELAPLLGGGGGGKDDVAQGGGTNADGVPEALERVQHLVAERVTNNGG